MTPSTKKHLDPSTTFQLGELIKVADEAIVSRELARTSGGTVTLFAFDRGQELSEHTAPFDALVQVLDGELEITIDGEPSRLVAGEVILMPADIPHALAARAPSRMLLVMLRETEKES